MTENLVVDHPEVATEMWAKLNGGVTGKLRSTAAVGMNPLVEMSSEHGPFLYNGPKHFPDVYRAVARTNGKSAQ